MLRCRAASLLAAASKQNYTLSAEPPSCVLCPGPSSESTGLSSSPRSTSGLGSEHLPFPLLPSPSCQPPVSQPTHRRSARPVRVSPAAMAMPLASSVGPLRTLTEAAVTCGQRAGGRKDMRVQRHACRRPLRVYKPPAVHVQPLRTPQTPIPTCPPA